MKEIIPDYFLINRSLLDSNRWLSEKFTRAQAWIDLIGLAQHTPNFFLVRGIKVSVNRGQLAYSQLTLSKRWKWSRDKVRRYLKCLENDEDIIQQNNEVTTIITIVKYDLWQGKNIETIQQTIQQKNNKQYTYKKDKKEKNNTIPATEVALTEEQLKHKKDIDSLISLFKDVNPSYQRLFGNKAQRAAADRLIKQYGFEKMASGVRALPEIINKKYAPRITSPYELERDLGKLVAFLNQEKQMKTNKVAFL